MSKTGYSLVQKCMYLLFFVFLYQAVWIFQGIDFTDEGIALAKQALTINGSKWFESGLVWFADYGGGFLLNLFGMPGILGTRLLFAFYVATLCVLLLIILSQLFPVNRVFQSLVILNFFYPPIGILCINYDTLGGGIMVISGGLFLVGYYKDSLKNAARFLLITSSGFLFIVAVMTRFPYVISIVPILLVISYDAVRKRMRLLGAVKTYTLLFSGIIIGLLFSAFILWKIDLLGGYAEKVAAIVIGSSKLSSTEDFNEYRLLSNLIKSYILGGIIAAIWGIVVFLTILLFQKLSKAIKLFDEKKHVKYSVGVSFISLIMIAPSFYMTGYVHHLFIAKHLFIGVMILGVAAIAVSLLRKYHVSRLFVGSIAIAAGIAIAAFFGSNTGIIKALHGSWLLFPLLYVFFLDKIHSDNSEMRSKIINCDTVIMLIIALCISGFTFRVFDTYRDSTNRLELNTTLKHHKLKGIYTTKNNASTVNSLLDKCDSLFTPGDVIMAYASMELLYYLTETNPAIKHCAPRHLSIGQLRDRLDELLTKDVDVKCLVRRKNVDNRSYQMADRVRLIETHPAFEDYKETWSNGEFVILERSFNH